jgi:hypothetical protein
MNAFRKSFRRNALFVGAMLACHSAAASGKADFAEDGSAVYQDLCVRCHGPEGQGVTGKCDDPLCGERSLESLARYISKKMPEDNPGICSDEKAIEVAHYIYDAFYSPAAQLRIHPVSIQLSHLTVRQYLNTVADLAESFFPDKQALQGERGLRAQYFNSHEILGNKRVLERVDSRIEFQYGSGVPIPEITGDVFSIRWTGSVIAEDTGDYEFRVKTENGVRVWLNDKSATLIDAWVNSSSETKAHPAAIRLTGGRAYPIQIDYFKFGQSSASLVLEWKPPHGTWEIVPARNLSSIRANEVPVPKTAFPPDDASFGFERGTGVSREWDEATTSAAIEMAQWVSDRIETLAETTLSETNAPRDVKRFCEEFAERAFRRPLTAQQKEIFVEKQFNKAKDLGTALKRVVLLVLKSPRFLYPGIADTTLDDYSVASLLALDLWDSLPDSELLRAAAASKLRTSGQVGNQVRRMLGDPRAKSKLRNSLQNWLQLPKFQDVVKDPQEYPNFNAEVLSDMRRSLNLFIDDIISGERSDYRQLLEADYLYLNKNLATFFGVPAPESPDFQKIVLAGPRRAGVITHPYLLTALAYYKRPSPIHRGVFLARNILGQRLKPPPKAMTFEDAQLDPHLTMREKVTQVTRSADCQSCHSVINSLGFTLENYDAVGRYQTEENNQSVDASGDFSMAEGIAVHFNGACDVAKFAADNADAHRGFVRYLFCETVKQVPAAYGARTLETLSRSFEASGLDIQSLLADIAKLSAAPLEESNADADPPVRLSAQNQNP